MRRNDFVDWLESRLGEREVAVSRWSVDPGLEDLEVRSRDGKSVRLRVVRTSPTNGETPADSPPASRPADVAIERR